MTNLIEIAVALVLAHVLDKTLFLEVTDVKRRIESKIFNSRA